MKDLPRQRFLDIDFVDADEAALLAALIRAARAETGEMLLMPGLDALERLHASCWRGATVLLASPALHRAAGLIGRVPPICLTPGAVWRGLLAGLAEPGFTLHVVCHDGRPVEAWAARLAPRRLTIGVPSVGMAGDVEVLARAVEVTLHHRADVTLLVLPAEEALALAAALARAPGARGLCLWAGGALPGQQERRPGLIAGLRALRLVLRGG